MKQILKNILLSCMLLSTQNYADVSEVEDLNYEDLSTPMTFEKSREGWAGSLGLGLHRTSFNILHYDDDPKSRTSIASSFKIGYNFTNQLGIQYINNVSWYKHEKDRYASGITGIGATYYFLPEQETWYASTALGIGTYANLSEDESATGPAFMATVGYEFSPHWQAEASWIKSSIDDANDDTLESSSLQFLINYSWY